MKIKNQHKIVPTNLSIKVDLEYITQKINAQIKDLYVKTLSGDVSARIELIRLLKTF